LIKNDLIIAVKDVEASSKWYQSLLGCKSIHGGNTFDVMVDENESVILCLHKWGEHDHPTMTNADIPSDNGLIIYLRTDKLETIRNNADHVECKIEVELMKNPNSGMKEFALRDLDGYYIIVSEYHNYRG